MSTTLINWAVVVGLLVLAVLILRWQIRGARAFDAKQAEFLNTATPPIMPTTAVLETEPGINLADRDACELLIADDPEFAARCDRLWAAIRDEQKKEAGDA
ncbi:hypothetical protein [Streptomyces sp. NPDC006739]|uniref:hypothetical protein n=1 Tax=Streptomyces sp. NPDC006739 TaxID=3364763 RepID=UPI0036CFA426